MNGALAGKTYLVSIQGCRTNQYEGEAIAAALESAGATPDEKSPDIAVIVTCTITAAADRKCRKLIRRLRRENPNSIIAACGCYAEKITDAERGLLGLDVVVGNRLKHKLPDLIAKRLNNGDRVSTFDDNLLSDKAWDALSLDRPRLHTRAFLKVQDGCSHYCSYCIVPFVRGLPVSRDIDECVEEARRIAASGCPEIVLTGIHIGLHEGLAELVRRVGAVDGIKRLRFGSVEPFAVDEELLNALAETPAFCRHLHLPLQSGDARVLDDMRRGYTPSGYAKIVDNIRARLGDDTHISTDLMVAFPTEDGTSFKNSLRFVKELGFGKVHVFPYSPREGTDAAKLKQQPTEEARWRTNEALALAEELHERYCSGWIGKIVRVLTEESADGIIHGLTKHYVRVTARAECSVSCETEVMPERYEHGILTCGKIARINTNKNFVDII